VLTTAGKTGLDILNLKRKKKAKSRLKKAQLEKKKTTNKKRLVQK